MVVSSPPQTCLPAHPQSPQGWKLDRVSPHPVMAGEGEERMSFSQESDPALTLALADVGPASHRDSWPFHAPFKPFTLCLAQFSRSALLPLCSLHHLPTQDVGALPTPLAQGWKQPDVTTTLVWPALTRMALCPGSVA